MGPFVLGLGLSTPHRAVPQCHKGWGHAGDVPVGP